MFKKLLSALTVMLVAFSINAGAQNANAYRRVMTATIEQQPGEFWEGYWDGNTSLGALTTKNDGWDNSDANCNVAICYPKGSAQIKGLTIEGIRFLIVGTDPSGIKDVSIWLSTTKPSKPQNADIAYKTINLEDLRAYDLVNPYNEFRFDKPYLCPEDKDIYIGYSFTVTPSQCSDGATYKYPLIVNTKQKNIENSSWVSQKDPSSSWAPLWKDFKKYGASPIQVLLKGETTKDIAAMTAELGSFTAAKDAQFEIPFEIQNKGNNAIKNVTIEADVNGVKSTVEAVFDSPIAKTGDKGVFKGMVKAPNATGSHKITAKITKINGSDFTDEGIANGEVFVVSKAVKRKVFVEEFTALNCGWCPRGLIALEKMKQEYGEDIVLASIHINDPMHCKDYMEFIDNMESELHMPEGNFDRTYNRIDPYFGRSESKLYGIDDDIQKLMKVLPSASVDVTYELKDNIVTANADVKFLYSGDANCALAYMITEDGLHDPTWKQGNNFHNEKGFESEPMFDVWTSTNDYIYDYVYNDVVIAAQGVRGGIDGSIPATVKDGEPIKHSVTFDLSNYKRLVKNVNNLRLAVVLINKANGQIINANSVKFQEEEVVPAVGTKASLKADLGSFRAIKDSEFVIPFEIQNDSTNAITSASVEVDVNGTKSTVYASLQKPLEKAGDKGTFEGKVTAAATTGLNKITAKIVKINGTDYADEGTAKGEVFVVSQAAKQKVFAEGFTSLNDSLAAKQLVAFEKLNKEYGEDVVLAAVHTDDDMYCKDYQEFINSMESQLALPEGNLNRTLKRIDPYYGTSKGAEQTLYGISNDVKGLMGTLPSATVDATYVFEDSVLNVASDIKFLYTGNADCSVGYIVTADSMHSEKWEQANGFYNQKGFETEPLFEMWTSTEKVTDYIYNNVVIAAQGIVNGIEGSIPASVKADESIKHEVTFDFKDYKKALQDINKLRLVVVVFDKVNGQVINTASVALKHVETVPAGITDIQNGSNAEAKAYYTIDGRRISAPQKGINIIRFADGTTKKVIVK